jgi:serine/threonine-protein kinase
MALAAGSRIGPYEIVEAIGAGGMGEVYQATDMNLGRDVAIKVLPEAFAQDAERLARFEREARALAALNHPNIAIIHGLETGPAEAGHYARALVMELVEGQTLADRIAKGVIPLDEALPIARQIAEALEAAHEQGIIHRDLKPANVKIRDDGTVKVLDFGLAKLVEPGSALAGSTTRDPAHGLTRDPAYALSQSPTITTPALITGVGMLLGTAAYMSPEQAKGRPADKRSDVWAFGCALFEMLTGRRAFDGEDITETIAAVVRADPHWDALPPDVPPSIRLLLRRCLEKDRKKRISDISAALFVLNEPELGGGWDPRRLLNASTPLWQRSSPAVASAILGAVIVGGLVWMWRPSPLAPAIARFSISLPNGQQFTNAGRPVIAVSPDGSRIVYVANQRLYLRSIADVEAKEIQGSLETEGITTPAFSPDGQWVAFVSAVDRTLKRISVDGGTAVPICPLEGTSLGVSWSDTGIIFGQRPGNVYRVSPNGGKPELLIKTSEGEAAYGAQMLPGGDAVLLTIGNPPDPGRSVEPSPDLLSNTHIVWQSLRSGERKTIIDRGADARYLSTGHIVYSDGDALLAVRFDPKRQEVIGDSVPVVQGVRRSNATPAAQYSVSNSGSLVYVPGGPSGRQRLEFIDRQGRTEFPMLPPAAYSVPRVSPDGKRIAVEVSDVKATNIWIYDIAGTSSIRQLTLEGNNRFPVWSGDGERVAFASDRAGDLSVWWQRADGSSPAEQLTHPVKGMVHAPLSWHPHEQVLLFIANNGDLTSRAGTSLYTYSVADKEEQPLTGVKSSQNLTAAFSRDGRWIAYHAVVPPSTRASVFVRPYPNRDETAYPVATGTHPVWAPSGSELLFQRATTLWMTRVTTKPYFATSVPVVVGAYTGGPTFWRNYDLTSDGRIVSVGNAGGGESGEAVAPQIEIVLNWTEELKRLVPVK